MATLYCLCYTRSALLLYIACIGSQYDTQVSKHDEAWYVLAIIKIKPVRWVTSQHQGLRELWLLDTPVGAYWEWYNYK